MADAHYAAIARTCSWFGHRVFHRVSHVNYKEKEYEPNMLHSYTALLGCVCILLLPSPLY